MTRRPRILAAGLAAAALLVAVVAGVPVLLLRIGTLPAGLPSAGDLVGALSRPDDGTVLLTVFSVIAWLAWASFTASVLAQLVAQARHVRLPKIPGLLAPETAGRLVAAVLALGALTAVGTATTPPAAAAPAATPAITVDLPAGTHTETRTVTQRVPREVTVERGDTLWGIAQEQYGDGTDWPRIYRANEGAPQAGGHLEDPDLIQPGLDLRIPGRTDTVTVTAPTPVPPATPPTQAPAGADASPPSQPANPAPSGARGPGASGSTTTATTETAVADENHQVVRAVSGLGALAAAGALGLLVARRARQSRSRRPGQRISLPAGKSAVAEAQLRAAADPLTVDQLDHALRSLAAAAGEGGLPRLRAARVTAEAIELYLVDETATLPSPSTPLDADAGVWVLDREQIPEPAGEQTAPYPTLVTLGHDEDDAHLLVNLEELRALAVTGPAAGDVVTALVLELIACAWADDVTVSLAGLLPELVDAIGSDRATYSDDLEHVLRGLEHAAAAETAAYREAGVHDATAARAAGLHADTWTPQLLIAGVDPTPEQSERLATLVEADPRVAVAVVTSGYPLGPWVLQTEHDGTAQLLPAGLQITPQVLRPTDRDALLAAFRTADEHHHDGPEWSHTLAGELTLQDLNTTPESPAGLDEPDPATPAGLPLALAEAIQTAPGPDEDLPAPVAPDGPAEPAAAAHGAPAGRVSLLREPVDLLPTDRPVLRLLGKVRVDGADPTHRPRASGVALRILTHLALNPGGGVEDLDQAVWPGQDKKASTRDPIISGTRRWLGAGEDGHPYLALWTPDGGYRLAEDLPVDWDIFQDLIGPDAGAAPLEDLVRALHLVDGKPLTGPRITETAAEAEIIATIADVAHEVATRACAAGEHALAEWATAKGITVEPVCEVLWRDRLRAAHQAGDPTKIRTIVADYDTHMDAVGGDHDPETDDLIAQIAV